MDKKGMRYLQGFPSYERSFNKRVLANDNEIGTAYEQAKVRGRLPFNRTKILVFGDHGVGKTSTCRRLQGKKFRHDEASTEGIETNTVTANVNDVNSKWCEVSNTPLEDYESSAAWWAVSHVREKDIGLGLKETARKTQLIGDLFYQIIINIPFIITFLFGGFTFGFGLVVWIYILCFISIFDVHSAYRFGSGFTIGAALVLGAMDIDEKYTELQIESAAMKVFKYGCVALIAGVIIGAGGRTGICIAFCLMVHPKQTVFTIENVTEILLTIYNKAYFKMIIYIFVVTGVTIFILRYVHAKRWSMSRRKCILVLIITIVFITAAAFSGKSYFLRIAVYTFSCIAVIVICIIIGAMKGRKYVAYGYIHQNYFVKKCSGFIAGIFIAVVCGWEFADLRTDILNLDFFKDATLNLDDTQYFSILRYLFSLLLFLAPITAFIVYECFAYIKVKNTSSIPITHVRQSMTACIRNESYLEARLSLWDFAGQEMYYNTHHLFMPKQGVYLVLFNAVKAVSNPEKQIKRLQFWLQSIAMHAETGNVLVFLVGTRSDSVDAHARSIFSERAYTHLYKRFSKLFAFHPSGSLFFFIENTLQVDQQRNVLRKVIYDEVKQLPFFKEKFKIKYLLFNVTLNKFRLRKCIITSLQEISEEAKSTCNIMSQNELLQFLNFFDRSGDVIYKERDELLREYVICDPQKLVNILTCLVNVPESHMRNRDVADYWQNLEDSGIVDNKLVVRICRVPGIWDIHSHVIHFLEGTHLLFPLNINNDEVGTYYISCRLPKIPSMSDIWNSNDDSQDIFYFDFGEILPEYIFLRLIAKCSCSKEFTWDKIYYDAARFRASNSCLFVINTQVISGNVDSYDRNLIKVAVHNEDQSQAIHVLQTLITFTEEIINQDFNPDYFREQYTCGPECGICSTFDGTMCLVNLITPDNDRHIPRPRPRPISTLNGYRPDQYHKVSLGLKLSVTCSRR